MAYIGTTPKDVRSFGKAKFDFTATASQTVFTGADDDGKTLGFTAGQISVYVNGILMDDSDFTVSNGNTVTLASPANAGDIISVVALQTDIPNSDYVPATGGTFSGDVAFQGAFTSRGIDDNATATAMTVDGSGNLLVAQSTSVSPGVTNTIAGHSLNNLGYAAHSRDAGPAMHLNRGTSGGAIVQLRKDGVEVGTISTGGVSSSAFRMAIGKGDTGLWFLDNLDSIVPFDVDGSVSRDDAVNLGYSSIRWKNLYLSGGVYMGGTTSSNYLDDYEEGTWTPYLISQSGLPNVTGLSVTEAVYTKIGNFVKVRAKLTFNRSVSEAITAGNYLQVGGLPFASNILGTTGLFGTDGQCHVYNLLGGNANAWGFISLAGTTSFYSFFQTVNGSPNTSDTLFFSMSYTT